MKRTGYLYDDRYLRHDTGRYHPESADRLSAIHNGIRAAGLMPDLRRIQAGVPAQKWIETVHTAIYIERFRSACQTGASSFDSPDNTLFAETFDTALLAVGGVLNAVRMVMEGDIDNAFCAVRPPGHHAEPNRAMGFCYFNNIAIAARYLRQNWAVERVGIIDFDVHHGNGVQHIFETDPSVYYYSVHQHPTFAYPGTGREFERGRHAGFGTTLNSTLLPSQGDKEYRFLLQKDLLPAMEDFKPEVILTSTGFDAHVDDDMADLHLSTEGFSWIMTRIVELADRYADGRLISVLEGGYCLERLPELAADHVRRLMQR